MTRMNRIKKLKKIRLHHEGTHILITSAVLLLLINAALYWGIECRIPFLYCGSSKYRSVLADGQFFSAVPSDCSKEIRKKP
mgnify:CR=1 FL=1